MTLKSLTQARFLDRPNRFTVIARIGSGDETAHLHDPGRLKELLFKGNTLLLRKASPGIKRKTSWDVIAAASGKKWVIINSSLHRALGINLFSSGYSPLGPLFSLKSEVKTENGRLDFYARTPAGDLWIETKGCTLFVDNHALFPDAPTARGSRHVQELISFRQKGFRAALVFFIFSSQASDFAPFTERDPLFSDMLYEAAAQGVEIYPLLMDFDGTHIRYIDSVSLVPLEERSKYEI